MPAPRLPPQVSRPAGSSLGHGQPVTNGPRLNPVSINGSTARSQKGTGWDKGSDVVVAANLQVTNYQSDLIPNSLMFTEDDEYNKTLLLNDPRSQVHTQKVLHELNCHLFNAHADPKLQTAEQIMDRWPVAGMVQTTTDPDSTERKLKSVVGVTVIPKGPAQAFDTFLGAQDGQVLYIILRHFDMIDSPQFANMTAKAKAMVKLTGDIDIPDDDVEMGAVSVSRTFGSGVSGGSEEKALRELQVATRKAQQINESIQQKRANTDEKYPAAEEASDKKALDAALAEQNTKQDQLDSVKRSKEVQVPAAKDSKSSSSSKPNLSKIKARAVGKMNARMAARDMGLYNPDETVRSATSFERSIVPREVVLYRQEQAGKFTKSTGFWQFTTWASPNGAAPSSDMLIHRTPNGVFCGIYRKIGSYGYRFVKAGTDCDETAVTKFLHPKGPGENHNLNVASLPSCMIMMSL